MSNRAAMAKLASWAKRFESLASPQYKSALTREMSQETLELIERGFKKESDPYGMRWRPKQRPNGQQTLVETGKMRKGFSAKTGLGRWQIDNTQEYTKYHQTGTSKMPKRQMYPSASRLPATWTMAYTKIFTRRTWALITKGKRR